MKKLTSDEEITREIKLNYKQADFLEGLYSMQYKGIKKAVMMGGIGSGKSVVLGHLLKMMVNELPGAVIQYACNTVSQAKRALTPTLKQVWRDYYDAVEYNPTTDQGEYILWTKPPKHWDKPYFEPDNWDNCISWSDGVVIEFCGYKLDPDCHRGRSDDVLVIDEWLNFKQEWLKIAEGRVRANVGKFDSSLHHVIAFFSSPPYGAEGEYMWQIEALAKENRKEYLFVHTCTLDNEMFLPKGYIEQKRRTMLPHEFDVEVMGKRSSAVSKSFYSSLNVSRHTDIDEDNFYSPYKSLIGSFDFNASFTSCTVWQDYAPEFRCIDNQFVKTATGTLSMAETLAVQICEEYRGHVSKTIVLTGDRNGSNQSASGKRKSDGKYITMYQQVADILISYGWEVVLCPLGYNPEKDTVYTRMQYVLADKDEQLYLRFHPVKAKQTLTSMLYTPIDQDFNKDKSSERRKTQDQATATHLSDTVDYIVIYVDTQPSAHGSSPEAVFF